MDLPFDFVLRSFAWYRFVIDINVVGPQSGKSLSKKGS